MSQRDYELREKFLFTLDWLLAVTKRYSADVRFGLVHINFATPRVLGDIYGAQEAATRLDEILHCLSKSFRKTDLVARDGVDFWILMPYTPTDEKLADKVQDIIEIASRSGLSILERDISIFALPLDVPELNDNCSAVDFLLHLKTNHVSLATREVSLSPCEVADATC